MMIYYYCMSAFLYDGLTKACCPKNDILYLKKRTKSVIRFHFIHLIKFSDLICNTYLIVSYVVLNTFAILCYTSVVETVACITVCNSVCFDMISGWS